ncbi:MAG: peptide chain release factor N(5)-glutamine methyltransferase [Eubacteriales bacterium]|nr:peptide chain release factor N(5)-glutamine methyltransferase [Eubacteriales bacterium]
MTLRELAREGEEKLLRAEVPEARHDALKILFDTFDITKQEYIMYAESDIEGVFKTLGPGIAMPLGLYRDRIMMRAARIPLQQILEKADFYGFTFKVNENVLVPRPDTEVLVETVLNEEKDSDRRALLDLCTGSGCIGISLMKHGNFDEVTLSDISVKALEVAALNAEWIVSENIGNVHLVESDMFEKLGKFDVIVSNPPYIRDDVIPTLMPEVRMYDPKIALKGGSDGLDFYRIIAREAHEHLNEGGRIYLEIGFDQAGDVAGLLSENGFKNIKTVKDYCENDRVVYADY